MQYNGLTSGGEVANQIGRIGRIGNFICFDGEQIR